MLQAGENGLRPATPLWGYPRGIEHLSFRRGRPPCAQRRSSPAESDALEHFTVSQGAKSGSLKPAGAIVRSRRSGIRRDRATRRNRSRPALAVAQFGRRSICAEVRRSAQAAAKGNRRIPARRSRLPTGLASAGREAGHPRLDCGAATHGPGPHCRRLEPSPYRIDRGVGSVVQRIH